MQQPADVGRELGGLGTGQEHAVIQRVKESRLADPAPFFHQLGVHDRNLTGRSAEADEAKLQPEAQGFTKGGMLGGWFAHAGNGSVDSVRHAAQRLGLAQQLSSGNEKVRGSVGC